MTKKAETTEWKKYFYGFDIKWKIYFSPFYQCLWCKSSFNSQDSNILITAIAVAMQWLGTTFYCALFELQQTIHRACIIHQQMTVFSNTIL